MIHVQNMYHFSYIILRDLLSASKLLKFENLFVLQILYTKKDFDSLFYFFIFKDFAAERIEISLRPTSSKTS